MSLFDLFYNKSIINLYVIFNNRNNKIIIFINSLLTIGLWTCSFVINFYTVNQSLYLGFLFFSTAFIFIFITLFILFVSEVL